MATRNTSHTGKARRPSRAGRTVIGDADIAHTGIIHVPADRVSADHINADRVDTHHRRVGPDRSITAAPGTTTAHPHTDSLQPRGLPHPGRMRPALSRLLKPVRHRAHTKRPPHGPGRPTAHHRRHHPRSPRAKQIVRPIPHTSRTRCRHTSSTARCSPRGKQASGRAASRR